MSPEIAASLEESESGSIPVQYSGWVPESREIPTYEALKSDIDADVIVIGAGITGASAALASERPGDLMLPVERPCAVKSPRAFHRKISYLLIPAARVADRLGLL